MKTLHRLGDGSAMVRVTRGAGRLLGVAVIVAAMALGAKTLDAQAMVGIATVVYCVTDDGAPPVDTVQTAMYHLGESGLELFATGKTDASGCGMFDNLPFGRPYVITAWTVDGLLVGNSEWIYDDPMRAAPRIELTAPGDDQRVWLETFAAQGFGHLQ